MELRNGYVSVVRSRALIPCWVLMDRDQSGSDKIKMWSGANLEILGGAGGLGGWMGGGLWILDFGFWTLDFGLWTLDFGLSVLRREGGKGGYLLLLLMEWATRGLYQ